MAQFGRVLGSGPRGRWFKSSHSDEKSVEMLKKLECFGFFRAFFGVFFGIITTRPLVPVRQSLFSNFFLTKMQDACRGEDGFLQRMVQKKEK